MNISAYKLNHKQLNERIKQSDNTVIINECIGQRFIGCGTKLKDITINGTPGNALGAYLNGSVIRVNGNAQDAVGDTMNDGKIIVNGSVGDAAGYAMRGGTIFIKGGAGYRAGIHMKEYKDKKPALVIGGKAGSFLGEYLAGGIIVVLGLNCSGAPVGNFTGTGMHGGKIFVKTDKELPLLPKQVVAKTATAADLEEISPLLAEFAEHFDMKYNELVDGRFYLLIPNAKNPYKQLYTPN